MTPIGLTEQIVEAGGQGALAAPLQVAIFLGGMAFLTSALVTLTAFTRIVIVLSFVRRALATQEIPPTPVLLGLSMFLTFFVMGPTFERIEKKALSPYAAKECTAEEAFQRGWGELREFMLKQTRQGDVRLFLELARVGKVPTANDIPARVLIPAFVTSELKTAFIMGFCLYVPFLLIDLVVAVILMSLGMMMMPPVVVSTPLKLLLFVLVDGWPVLLRSLSSSFS
jgi:flagellar biosynthetic protein FliP